MIKPPQGATINEVTVVWNDCKVAGQESQDCAIYAMVSAREEEVDAPASVSAVLMRGAFTASDLASAVANARARRLRALGAGRRSGRDAGTGHVARARCSL